ncbi:hypothetical protein J1614_000520 [Plenodomus biglobosus]|nr:hypothetical protein J1614_000520 [Plenodomus biglobosus]
MDQLRISDLGPALPTAECQQFRASVILIWPYSSSQRQFALLLADPDFRLRRRNGQVRARFTGSSARALATTGVGIGDEVLLSLRGAQFVKEGAVQTPGRSIEWELEYAQTVIVTVFRNGREMANLELIDVAPTPTPQSPAQRVSLGGPSPSQQWSSPAVLKRIRLSEGPFFDAPYNPLAEDIEQGHDRKRRRKSYRDWKAWTYSARTPSPDKNDDMEEDLEDEIEQRSPIRAQQLPDTPISPSKPESATVATGRLQSKAEQDKQQPAHAAEPSSSGSEADDSAPQKPQHDTKYHELYAEPNDLAPEDSQYAFGGDTEIDTEANTEEEEEDEEDAAHAVSEGVIDRTTVANTEEERVDDSVHRKSDTANIFDTAAERSVNNAELFAEVMQGQEALEPLSTAQSAAPASGALVTREETATTGNILRIGMPPPTLPILQKEDAAPVISDLLTPIGREPSSPTLKPLDSSTLPLPSPFPGTIDTNMTSYQDYFAANQDATIPETAVNEEPELPSDADYIMETSFFSSIGSSKDPSHHPNHESAFTPVRFTFGMDGGGWSRPLNLSSPAPENAEVQETPLDNIEDSLHINDEIAATIDPHRSPSPRTNGTKDESKHIHVTEDAEPLPSNVAEPEQPDIIELSSGSEAELGSEISESEDEAEVTTPDVVSEISEADSEEHDDESSVEGTQGTGAIPEIIDLGSPPADDTDQGAEIGTSPAPAESHETSLEGHMAARSTQQNTTVRGFQDTASSQDDRQSNDSNDHSEFADTDFAPEAPSTVTNTQQRIITHTPAQQALATGLDTAHADFWSSLDHYTQTALNESDTTRMQDVYQFEEVSNQLESPMRDDESRYPEVKMESIEEDSIFEELTQLRRDDRAQTPDSSSGELVIAVPEEGGKVGELHTMAVPATGPARNTRSKLSITVSPTRERTQAPRRATRSNRSNASVTRDTLSPAETRSRATVSASQEPSQTSPYSLRSQSKLLSPVKPATSAAHATTRQSPRKLALQKEKASQMELDHSRVEDVFDPGMFDPSYEPSASQGRFSNVGYVKDSEEDSVRSEHSISTAYQTDSQFGLYSDPVQRSALTAELEHLKLPPASAPEPKMRYKGRKAVSRMAELLRSSSPMQPTSPFSARSMADSPSRRLRSAGLENTLPEGETSAQGLSRHAIEDAEEPEDQTTPKAIAIQHRAPQAEIESTLVGEASYAQQQIYIDEYMHSSPPSVINTSFPTVTHDIALEGNTLLTPDNTQQNTMGLEPIYTSTQYDNNNSLITPDLTQATSPGLPSQQAKAASNLDSSTLNNPSSDASPSPLPLPSIGLSTPLAYYTPLSSLHFFLNRSSQYHSSETPDILALATSPSTPPARAKKGPKHAFTTFHITDLSIHPRTTTVTVFRPYEAALPIAHAGDVILLRAFSVLSVKGRPSLRSTEDSAWCVWRWGKPCWGARRGAFGEIRAREEVKGPQVERGVGEWGEVERIREWWVREVKELMERGGEDKETEGEEQKEEKDRGGVVTRSRDRIGSQL